MLSEVTKIALQLSPRERLQLARRLLESLPASSSPDHLHLVTQGVQRIEDVASGKIPGLTESQFRRALR
jgi:hypothetical protein